VGGCLAAKRRDAQILGEEEIDLGEKGTKRRTDEKRTSLLRERRLRPLKNKKKY